MTLWWRFAPLENTAAKVNILNSIAVIPNPLKNTSANIILQLSKAAPVNIEILDLSGRILKTQTLSNIIKGKNNYSYTGVSSIFNQGINQAVSG